MKSVGLIGCGLWGQNILRDLLRLGCRVHVCDIEPERRAEALQQGAETVTDRPQSLAPVDGFVISSPASTHLDIVAAIADARRPIYCEKPFATDSAAARRIAGPIAHRLFVMHVWRHHAGVQALRDIAGSGELGSVRMLRSLRANWTSPRRDVDPVWTLAPHDLSICLEVLGEIPRPRFATLERREDGRPVGMLGVLGDCATPGPECIIEVSTRYGERHREVRIHGTSGVAVLRDDALEILRGNELQPAREARELDAMPALLRELECFVKHLAGGPAPASSVEETIAMIEALEALRALAGDAPR
ncbi:MAG: Gfo/Idh/MocA family oxidoreductase [Pseudomonadota bacterium]